VILDALARLAHICWIDVELDALRRNQSQGRTFDDLEDVLWSLEVVPAKSSGGVEVGSVGSLARHSRAGDEFRVDWYEDERVLVCKFTLSGWQGHPAG